LFPIACHECMRSIGAGHETRGLLMAGQHQLDLRLAQGFQQVEVFLVFAGEPAPTTTALTSEAAPSFGNRACSRMDLPDRHGVGHDQAVLVGTNLLSGRTTCIIECRFSKITGGLAASSANTSLFLPVKTPLHTAERLILVVRTISSKQAPLNRHRLPKLTRSTRLDRSYPSSPPTSVLALWHPSLHAPSAC